MEVAGSLLRGAHMVYSGHHSPRRLHRHGRANARGSGKGYPVPAR